MRLYIEGEREALLLFEAVRRKYNLLKDSLEMQNFVCKEDKEQLREYHALLEKVDNFYRSAIGGQIKCTKKNTQKVE